MNRTKFSEEQIAYALRQAESGTPVGDVCRQLGVSEATFYVWKRKFAHLGVSELRRLGQLEDENNRLNRLVADGPAKQYANGSLFLDSSNPFFIIDNVEGHSGTTGAYQGYQVYKEGRTSGLTYGIVSDPRTTYITHTNFYDVMWVCFTRASGTAQGGDSGSPVFGAPASFVGATLYGFLSAQNGRSCTYSTMSNLWYDLSLNESVWLFCAC